MALKKAIVFDIETAGTDFESLDEHSKEFMLKFAESDEQEQEVKESTSFYPLTAQVVAIGMIDSEKDEKIVIYQCPPGARPEKADGVDYLPFKTEKELLETFWRVINEYKQVITFNGRGFDCPFLMIRSAICGVKPLKNLMPNRYSSDVHVDLLDRLTFYGSMRRRFNLHMWCKAFGIESPKEGEVTGYHVKDLFHQGKYLDIARYCIGDVVATKKLYQYWENYLSFRD